jgi:predicted nucleic acid-binding protein
LSFVVDASILAAWFLNEKTDPRVEAAFDTVTRVETRAPIILY